MHGQGAGPVGVFGREVHLAGAQPGIAQRRLLQFLHQMLALGEEAAELLAVFPLLQLADLFHFHARLRATASATLMPSTPAESMPPA